MLGIAFSLCLTLSSFGAVGGAPQPAPQRFAFEVRWPESAMRGPFTGRVVVFLAKSDGRDADEPRLGPNWFAPGPMFAADFTAVGAGQPMRIASDDWIEFPAAPARIEKGEYVVQAVIDRDLGGRTIGNSPGNLYSEPRTETIDPDVATTISIECDRVVEDPTFVGNDRVQELRVESKLLSEFYGRMTWISGAVALPEEWEDDPERRFPVYYSVPGFGGTHWNVLARGGPSLGTSRGGEPFLCVTLDPDCPGGHCVFADSENNGPWGTALVTEFIPECEKRFRGIGDPGARFVGGHSSGGWSSLWLQVTYPDVFGGCWSTSPDPVDFRDFQLVDIYAPGENMFVDRNGVERCVARLGGGRKIYYRAFSDMERPLRGEQLGSFEWVFSPRGEDDKPVPLWDRKTGAIDLAVADAWKRYDIGLTLRTRWKELEPVLAGKIHVYMGTEDTFYLDGAVRLLKKDLAALHADAVVELFPGDHGSVMTPALLARIDSEMAAQFGKWKSATRRRRVRAWRHRVRRSA